MNKTINYTQDWHVDISKMSEREWNQLVQLCDNKGIRVFIRDYASKALVLYSNGTELWRAYNTKVLAGTPVSILEMFNRLERPIKSTQQIKIEELEATIKAAMEQIQEIKEGN
jgi:hypothetical protein